MCELLVNLVDKHSADPYSNAQLPKRGDVIVIVEDGWEWSSAERSNPAWLVVKVPGVPAEAASGFVAREVNEDHAHPSRMLQYRAFRFDLRKAPANLGELMQAKLRKPKLVDPNIL